MKPFCEIVALQILPAVRAMVARKLIDSYGLSQGQAAERLGVSQPAISQYKRDVRGYKSELFKDNPEIVKMVNSVSEKLATSKSKSLNSTIEFCKICKILRFSGSGCDIHKKMDPSLEKCNVCLENQEFYGGAKAKRKKSKGIIRTLKEFK